MPKKPTLNEIDEAIEVFELRIFDDKLNIQEERETIQGDYVLEQRNKTRIAVSASSSARNSQRSGGRGLNN